MARVTDRRRWATGDTLNVDPVNDELRSLVGEMNGHLDRENLQGGLTGDKFVDDTFNNFFSVSGTSSTITDVSSSQSWSRIDGTTVLCEDGRLEVEAVAVASENLANGWWALGITVDGALVARTPPSDMQSRTTLRVIGAPPVGAGTRTVNLVAQVAPGSAVATLATLTVGNYLMLGRSVVR